MTLRDFQLNLNLKLKGKLDKPDIGSISLDLSNKNQKCETVSITASLRSKAQSRAASRAASEAPSRGSSDDTEISLEADTIAKESHVTDLLNEAVMMDTVLEDIQVSSRPRPKHLLLGK